MIYFSVVALYIVSVFLWTVVFVFSSLYIYIFFSLILFELPAGQNFSYVTPKSPSGICTRVCQGERVYLRHVHLCFDRGFAHPGHMTSELDITVRIDDVMPHI